MSTQVDNEILQLKVENLEHRVEILEDLLHNAKDVLTIEEASIFLGISKSCIYKMTHMHELPFYRPNGKLIYLEKSELLKWMRQNRNKSDEEVKDAAIQHMNDLCK